MARKTVHPASSGLWKLARTQHGVVTRKQLLSLGFSRDAVDHRLAKGRLHQVMQGVYVVGRPALDEFGRWTAAVLRCGHGALLSHGSAAAAWKIRRESSGPIEVTVPQGAFPRPPGVWVHRRANLPPGMLDSIRGIPLTSPTLTLVDIAGRLSAGEIEAAINQMDKRELIGADALRGELEELAGRSGVAAVRRCLDRPTFSLTDSELERRFMPIARAAGLPLPLTGQRVNGFKVDFYWPELGLVVETDGLRYHRTPAQQARDRRRDQAHARSGLTALRFTYAQVRFEAGEVRATIAAVAGCLESGGQPAKPAAA